VFAVFAQQNPPFVPPLLNPASAPATNCQQQYAVLSHTWLSSELKVQDTSRLNKSSIVVLLLGEIGASSRTTSSGHTESTAEQLANKTRLANKKIVGRFASLNVLCKEINGLEKPF